MLRRAHDAGVGAILAIGIGEGPAQMYRAAELAEQYAGRDGFPKIYASVGVHPSEGADVDAAVLERVASIAKSPKVIAIGEIGLDYYHADNPLISVQQRVFVQQMEIAAAAKLPILIHCRTSDAAKPEAKAKYAGADAWADLLDLIEENWSPTGLGGVMHCFSGSTAVAQRSLDAGFLISFAGNITYPSAQGIRDAAAYVSLAHTLIETDAPFLAPVSHRGQRNESAYVGEVAKQLAEIHKCDVGAIGAATSANFARALLAPRGLS